MTSTVFVNGVTLSDEDWFNDLNRLHYTILSDPADLATLKTTVSPIHTRQVLLSGSSATYTTPALCRQLFVRMKGGGGGGQGSGTTYPNGGTGGTTSFNSIEAAGGSGDPATRSAAGAGSASFRLRGAPGGNSSIIPYNATPSYIANGGNGGGFGGGIGGGAGGWASTAGIANTGGGGGGGGLVVNFTPVANGGAGGQEGEYVELIINSPAATYTYTVGAGGTAGSAGTSGSAGSAGGSGFIVVDEYY